ncbi:MAG TPA: PAS domain S-box protein [Candidatus Cybelea sp.]|nr:PAS domain S-box protein [Candidatus Cybelea sp.]
MTRSKRTKDTSSDVERRQWWLSFSTVVLSLILTLGILALALPLPLPLAFKGEEILDQRILVDALVGLVCLFDLSILFQQFEIYRVRKQIREQEELFKLISENAADLIAVVNIDGTRAYNSPSYRKLLGYSPEELRGTLAFEQIHPEDRAKVIAAAEEAKTSGVGRRVEYRMRHKDGNWIALESTASVVRDSQGQIQKFVIVNRDITERKQLEQQLRLAQKIEAIGRLSGGIAHDFNNLLGVIIGYTEAAQKRMEPGDRFREANEEIQRAARRAASLTQQLLAFSRKQVLEPKVLDLNAVVRDVEKMLVRLIGAHIALALVLPESVGMVKADRTQLEQVILNLALNARDAMPEGGRLVMETSSVAFDERSAARPRYMPPGHYVLLKVSDTGCGMKPEVEAHIFEPFFTTKEKGKGTGLGLATVYGVIKQSGGYILVESQLGKGTAFKIYLPLVASALETADAELRPPARVPEKHEAAVLLVEDEASLRKLTREVLEETGYRVFEAADALEALEVAKRSEIEIDLLLTDVIMPGMSGRALADALSTARPDTRVLFMSGYTDGEMAKHGILNAGTAILHKPFTQDELIRRVEEALECGGPLAAFEKRPQS